MSGDLTILKVCSNPQFKLFGRNELDLFLIDLAGTTLGHIEP